MVYETGMTTDSLMINLGLSDAQQATVLGKAIDAVLARTSCVWAIGRNAALDQVVAARGLSERVRRGHISEIPTGAHILVVEDSPQEMEWRWTLALLRDTRASLLRREMAPFLLEEVGKQLGAVAPPDISANHAADMARIAQAINSVAPLAGKRVAEFGPLDGAQTASFIPYRPESIDAFEIRPDNYLRVEAAARIYDWPNVRLHLEDFHAVNALSHGRFDICIAHGVYYHSNAPFVFLENLASLSDLIVIGGYCATEASPPWAWMMLDNDVHRYRAKPYEEASQHSTAGVSATGYFFAADDLKAWFVRAGYEIAWEESLPVDVAHRGGEYLRFIARK